MYLLALYVTQELGKPIKYEDHANYFVICNLFWIICAFLFKLYNDFGDRIIENNYRATWKTVVLHLVLFVFYLIFSRHGDFSRTFLVFFYAFLVVSCIISRFAGTLFQYLLFKNFNVAKTVAIMGNNYTAARLKRYLKQQRNFDFYGFIDFDANTFSEKYDSLSDNTLAQITAAAEAGVGQLYVCIPPEKMGGVDVLVREAEKLMIRLKFIPDMGGSLATPYTISYMGNEFPMITLREDPLENISNRFKKRAFDMIFSTLVIIFILSWLYPLIALLIKLESKGPVLFKQLRSGRDDKAFICYKFRSMRINGDSNLKQATKNDSRITRMGKFLRKTSLDEMPQFLNVFQGKMSIVGPRPHMLKHTEEYSAIIDKFMVRHFSKPGITGWAQINGLRGETKETEDMERRVEHDIYYLENWSLMWDIRIIFLTVINVIRGDDNVF